MKTAVGHAKHYFFPGETNNQKARILHPSFLSLFVALFLTGQFFLNYFGLFFPRVLGYASNIFTDQLVTLTNQERTKNGLSPLSTNAVLAEAAQRKAGDMFALDYWAHNSPTGRTPWAFFNEAGYKYSFAGENLARDFNDSGAVVTAWMDSPTHRDNILNNQYQEIGIAVVDGMLNGVETTLVVQLFGSPVDSTAVLAGDISGQSDSLLAKLNPSKPRPALAGGEATFSASLDNSRETQPFLNPFSLTKTLVILAIGTLLGVLVFDLYLISKKRMIRLSGRSLAHLTFLLFLLLAVLILRPGLVL